MKTRFAALFLLLLLAACDRLPREGGLAPYPPPRRDLAAWPYQEVWHGLAFNGHRIGFSRLALGPAEEGLYEIASETAMAFRLLGQPKRTAWRSRDWVDGDLQLRRFEYHLTLDASHLVVVGAVRKGMLDYTVTTSGVTTRRTLPTRSPVHPLSALALLPLRQGLEVGGKREFLVFDGETRTLANVTQEVVAFAAEPRSGETGFRLRTLLHGQEVETWLSREGIPRRESSFGGALEATPEPKEEAVAQLARAALDKSETLLDFSLVPATTALARPERTERLQVRLQGLPASMAPLPRGHQSCEDAGSTWTCDIVIPPAHRLFALPAEPAATTGDLYLKSSPTVQSDHHWVKNRAWEIVGRAAGEERVRALVRWMEKNLKKTPVDALSALDVLNGRQGECQGFGYLFTAFARALAMPTRVVNGLVYSREHQGFLYHTWAETLLAGRWVPVDPILGQFPADATHIALTEGEEPAALLPLGQVIGRLHAEILDSDP